MNDPRPHKKNARVRMVRAAAALAVFAGVVVLYRADVLYAAQPAIPDDWQVVYPERDPDSAWRPQGKPGTGAPGQAAPTAPTPPPVLPDDGDGDVEGIGGSLPRRAPERRPLPVMRRGGGESGWPLRLQSTGEDAGDEDVKPSVPLDQYTADARSVTLADAKDEPMLLKRLADVTDPFAAEAVVSLGRLGTPAARQAIRHALREDYRDEVRLAAIQTLMRHESAAEDKPYVAVLSHGNEDSRIRAEAAFWAGYRKDEECLAALTALNRRPGSPWAEYASAWALARLGDPLGWRYMRMALQAPDMEEPPLWVARGLGEMENVQALPLLYPLLERSDALREQAALSLERYPEEAHRAYLAQLPADERAMRVYRRLLMRYALSLQKDPPPDFRRMLLQGREEDRLLGIAGLARNGVGADIPLLLEMLDAEERRLGGALAVDALDDYERSAGTRRGTATPARRVRMSALIRDTLRAVAARAGLAGMPGPAVSGRHHLPAAELPDTNRMWRRWWYGQFRTVAGDGVRARLRDPIGGFMVIDSESVLPGGAYVESVNADGRGTVRLIAGDGNRVDVRPWTGEGDVADAPPPSPSTAPPTPPAGGGMAVPPALSGRRWAQ